MSTEVIAPQDLVQAITDLQAAEQEVERLLREVHDLRRTLPLVLVRGTAKHDGQWELLERREDKTYAVPSNFPMMNILSRGGELVSPHFCPDGDIMLRLTASDYNFNPKCDRYYRIGALNLAKPLEEGLL